MRPFLVEDDPALAAALYDGLTALGLAGGRAEYAAAGLDLLWTNVAVPTVRCEE
jgi:hypothetical protein